MAADPLNLLPSLRPWHRAGVEFLLAEQPLPAPYSLCIAPPPANTQKYTAAQPAGRPPVAQGPRPVTPPRTAAQNAPPPSHEAAPSAGQRSSGQSPQAHAPAVSSRPSRPTANTTAAPAPVPSAVPPLALLPADQWPALWQERLRKTAPAAVLWTYWALGEDMCVRPNPQRRALLQRLLGDLGHPAGTHSFWPAAMPADPTMTGSANPEESTLQANALVFWSGVHALKARALVVMGSPAIKALDLPPRLRPFQQTRHNGRLVVVLRDVDFLAQEIHRYDAVKEFLKQALAPFGR